VFLTVAATTFVRSAAGASPEPSRIAPLEEPSSTQVQEDRCPFQQTRFLMNGISVENVTLDYRGQELQIRIRESSDELSILGFDRRVPYLELGRFEFSDGTLCTGDLVDRGFDLAGTDESEIIVGTNAADRIRGKRGNDTLEGAGGDDVYLYESGDGVDCIQDSAGRTTIAFGAGIAPQDLVIAEAGGSAKRTLFLRVLPTDSAVPSQGLNIRTGSTVESLPPDFRFMDGSTFTLPELQRVAKRGGLNPQALARERVCYFGSQSAARAGRPNKRSHSPPLPPLPAPEKVVPHNSNTIMVPGSDGRVRGITEQQCIVSASGERTCRQLGQ
jgi:hypothetical protein